MIRIAGSWTNLACRTLPLTIHIFWLIRLSDERKTNERTNGRTGRRTH